MAMTDVGTTKRRPMTPARRLRIWEAHKGICVTCKLPIKAGDKWFIEHIRALELGGEDTDENCGPAHTITCKAVKDAEDHSRAAKAKRAKMRQIGIKDEGKPKIRSAGFPKVEKQPKTLTKPLPPRQPLYRQITE